MSVSILRQKELVNDERFREIIRMDLLSDPEYVKSNQKDMLIHLRQSDIDDVKKFKADKKEYVSALNKFCEGRSRKEPELLEDIFQFNKDYFADKPKDIGITWRNFILHNIGWRGQCFCEENHQDHTECLTLFPPLTTELYFQEVKEQNQYLKDIEPRTYKEQDELLHTLVIEMTGDETFLKEMTKIILETAPLKVIQGFIKRYEKGVA